MRRVFTGSPEYPEQVRTLPFTRALLAWAHHLSSSEESFSFTSTSVPEIERGLYVDDLLMGDQTVQKAWKIKATTEIFGKASFKLYK